MTFMGAATERWNRDVSTAGCPNRLLSGVHWPFFSSTFSVYSGLGQLLVNINTDVCREQPCTLTHHSVPDPPTSLQSFTFILN